MTGPGLSSTGVTGQIVTAVAGVATLAAEASADAAPPFGRPLKLPGAVLTEPTVGPGLESEDGRFHVGRSGLG